MFLESLLAAGGFSCERWSATDKDAGLLISADGYTASYSAGGTWRCGRGVVPIVGKAYWEVLCSAAPVMTGISRSGGAFHTGYAIGSSDGVGYYSGDGMLYYNLTSSAFGATFGAAHVVGHAYDPATGMLWLAKNGAWQGSGNPSAGTNPARVVSTASTWFPAIGCYQSGGIAVGKFDPSTWTYSPPAGFGAVG